MNATKLVSVREPNRAERKRGAEIVFVRRDGRYKFVILAAKCYESWEQWGAPREVLGDNVPTVERWRQHGMECFD